MSTTKTQVRADWRYVRECIRQAEVALKKDDVEELRALALEITGGAAVLLQYLSDNYGIDL
jgi:hypothetical protein